MPASTSILPPAREFPKPFVRSSDDNRSGPAQAMDPVKARNREEARRPLITRFMNFPPPTGAVPCRHLFRFGILVAQGFIGGQC